MPRSLPDDRSVKDSQEPRERFAPPAQAARASLAHWRPARAIVDFPGTAAAIAKQSATRQRNLQDRYTPWTRSHMPVRASRIGGRSRQILRQACAVDADRARGTTPEMRGVR